MFFGTHHTEFGSHRVDPGLCNAKNDAWHYFPILDGGSFLTRNLYYLKYVNPCTQPNPSHEHDSSDPTVFASEDRPRTHCLDDEGFACAFQVST